jgi:hypothetical protein
MLRQGFLLGVLLASGPAAQAENHAVAAKAGLLGVGLEYTYTVGDRLAVRGGINGAQYGFDATESGIEYDFDLIWDSLTANVDIHPLKGPFRISLGLLSNDNGLEASSRLASSLNVGGTVYTPSEVGTLRAVVEFDSTAPFVGLGWDWSRKTRKFGVSFDIGVVNQGSPRLTLVADGDLIGDPTFADDLETERLELQAELEDFDLLPFAALGFVFKF